MFILTGNKKAFQTQEKIHENRNNKKIIEN